MRINERYTLLAEYLSSAVLTNSREDTQNVGLISLLSRPNETGRMRERTSYLLDFIDIRTLMYGHA